MPVPLYLPGAPLSEFTLETVIRDGLNEIRLNPNRLDNLFGRLLQAHFNNQYGQSKVDEIKQYFQNNQIKIVQAFSQVPKQVPCISIQMISSNEPKELQYLGDEFGELDTNITPRLIVDDVTGTAFNLLTGRITIDNSVNLGPVCPGMIFVDASDVKFKIISGNSNLSGNKYITIESNGNEPDLSAPGRIESKIDFMREDIRAIKLRETISIGCHASNNVHLAKFLYAVVIYILSSRKESLIERGIGMNMEDATLFDREDEYNNENIYSRYVNMTFLTDFTWNQGEVNLIDCFDVTLNAEENGEKFQVSPTESED